MVGVASLIAAKNPPPPPALLSTVLGRTSEGREGGRERKATSFCADRPLPPSPPLSLSLARSNYHYESMNRPLSLSSPTAAAVIAVAADYAVAAKKESSSSSSSSSSSPRAEDGEDAATPPNKEEAPFSSSTAATAVWQPPSPHLQPPLPSLPLVPSHGRRR